MADDQGFEEEGTLLLDQRFAIVPEWIIDASISDCAFRLYALLLRYGQSSGQRMPGRALLAKRLHKGSKDTVDRALKELVAIGAVVVERRRAGRQNLTNRYHLRTSPTLQPTPGRTDAATPPGRRSAATPGGRTPAATPGRSSRAKVAAGMRPDPVVLTEKEPPPSPPQPSHTPTGAGGLPVERSASDQRQLLARCGIADLDALAVRCQQLRRDLGQPSARWSGRRLVEVLHEAVVVKGWPAQQAETALLAVASDPLTKSPTRLACPGPWWDTTEARRPLLTSSEVAELSQLEVRLRESDGRRVWAQQRARADLADRGELLTRLAVARRACQLLDEAELTPC